MAFVAVVVLGAISLGRLPIDLLPDIAYPRLVVHTSWPNVAPAEVERLVTEPIEQAVSTVPGVQRVESVSREATSLVTIRFAWGTDMDFAALNVRERLDDVAGLPDLAAAPVVLRTDPRSEPILALSVAGDADAAALKDLAESVFRRRLEQIDGIAQAALAGGLEREIQVEVDPRRLESYGLTVDDVSSAIDAANAAAPGGTIRRGRFRYSLRTLGELSSVEEIAEIPIPQHTPAPTQGQGQGPGQAQNSTVVLRDIADVTDGFKERESLARYNGREAVGLLLFKESGANTVRVTRAVESVLAELRAQYPNVAIEVASSQARFISQSISTVVQEIVLGALLAFLVLVLFMREVRYPVAIALAIPISVIGSLALLDLFDVSLNLMSLGGLALGVGLLVDNSIVVAENIFRHREKGLAGATAAAVGAEEVRTAIVASTLTTVAVFGPVMYVQGVAGALFRALSLAVAFSLLASLVVALTLLPMMAARLARRTEGPAPAQVSGGRFLGGFDRAFARFAGFYERVLVAALEHRRRTLAIAVALLVVTIGLTALLPRSLLPRVDQGAFRARIELPRGTPLDETSLVAARLERGLLADPAVEAVFTRVGRRATVGGVEIDESGLHTAVLDVRLKDGASTADAMSRARSRLDASPRGAVSLGTGQATALGGILGESEADIAVRVRGDDLDAAQAHAERLRAELARGDRLANVRLGVERGAPEVRLTIDRERAAAYGIEPRAVAQTIESYMRGATATEFVDFERRIPIVVRLPEEWRRSLGTLDVLRVQGVPLRELVRTSSEAGSAEIRRLEQSRVVPVYADATGGVDDALDVVRAAVGRLPAPSGLRIEVGGENEEMRRSFRNLAFAFAIALLLVYMILAAEFESLVHPFTVLLSVPLALFGAVLALLLTGAGLNTVSLIGFVILIGIVDNDAVVKIDFIEQARRRGASVRQAIMEAGRARLRPIVMNTLTAMFGVLPMALGLGAGAELQAPMAIAVFGGLFSATALTLVVIPVVYETIEDARTALTRRRAAQTHAHAQPIPPTPTKPKPQLQPTPHVG